MDALFTNNIPYSATAHARSYTSWMLTLDRENDRESNCWSKTPPFIAGAEPRNTNRRPPPLSILIGRVVIDAIMTGLRMLSTTHIASIGPLHACASKDYRLTPVMESAFPFACPRRQNSRPVWRHAFHCWGGGVATHLATPCHRYDRI